MGDGFLALFGAPVAHEDHARRGVLAALELRQRWQPLTTRRGQLHGSTVCLGLDSGPVVVGPLRHDAQWPYFAVGAPLSGAIRLQQQATPDMLLCSATTYALVQGEVQGEPLASNGPGPVESVHAIQGLRQRRAGVLRHGARPLSRFIGRGRELTLLHERLALAARGQGQVLGMAGEPGMGKSRLLAEFAHSLRGQPVTYCEGHCLAYGSTTPYLPVRDLLQQFWSLPDAATPEALSAPIQQRLHAAGVDTEVETLLLLQLLDVPAEAEALAALSPEVRRARTFALLRQIFLQASQRQPLVLAVENLHWSDPTSDEWLTTLAAQLGGAAILLLGTYRPGYQLPWLAHSWSSQIALPPLTPLDSLALVQAVPQAARLPAHQQQAMVARAAGNPFFLEELAWAVVESGEHARPLALPETIQAVLAARLDRLPPEVKHLTQTAAVIGLTVPVPVLKQAAGLAEEVLQRALAHLQEAELLYEMHLLPDPVYTFKHALTQEAAYGSLLQERRRALHAQIVDGLETLAGDRGAEQIEQLAHHALRGQVWDKAFRYCQQAGARASARYAYQEAEECWEQALEALAHLPADRTTREQAIDLRFALIAVQFPLAHWEKRLTHLHAAEAIAAELEDQLRLGEVYHTLAVTFVKMQDYDPALVYCRRAHATATALGNVDLQMKANYIMGTISFALGDYRQAITCYQQLLITLARRPDPWLYTPMARLSIYVRVNMVQCLSQLGEFATAMAYGDEARQIAEADERPCEHVIVDSHVGTLYLSQGTLPPAIPLLERAVALSQDGNIPVLYPTAAAALACAYARAGRRPDTRAILEQMGELESLPLPIPLYCGDAYLRAGAVEEAHRLAQQTLADACKRKMQGWEAWARWLLGESVLRGNPPDLAQAEMHYQQALTLASALGMRPLVAHCHLGLGTLYVTIGRQEQARFALSTAIAFYRAMEMTWWLPQAEAALAQVV